MGWRRENAFGGAVFHDPAGIKYYDAIRERRDRRQIVTNEYVGHLKLFAQILEEVYNPK